MHQRQGDRLIDQLPTSATLGPSQKSVVMCQQTVCRTCWDAFQKHEQSDKSRRKEKPQIVDQTVVSDKTWANFHWSITCRVFNEPGSLPMNMAWPWSKTDGGQFAHNWIHSHQDDSPREQVVWDRGKFVASRSVYTSCSSAPPHFKLQKYIMKWIFMQVKLAFVRATQVQSG